MQDMQVHPVFVVAVVTVFQCLASVEDPIISAFRSYLPGDRGLLHRHEPNGDGPGRDKAYVMCVAKGAGSDLQILDPYTRYDIHHTLIRVKSKAACTFAVSYFGTPTLQVSNGPGTPSNVSGSLSNVSSCTENIPALSCCPGVPTSQLVSGMPGCGQSGPHPRGTSSWRGEWDSSEFASFAFKINNVNGVSMDMPGQVQTVSTSLIHGVAGARTVSSTSGWWASTLYDGGLIVTTTRHTDLTYRAYMFKNDQARASAKNDTRNKGLEYAHPFVGKNGCETEVVFEIKPKLGGGLSLGVGLLQLEPEVISSMMWYATDIELVFLVSTAALQEWTNLIPRNTSLCQKNTELLRWSRTFICKSTGERVSAQVRAQSNLIGTPANPARFADTGLVAQMSGDGPSFTIEIPPGSATANCGTLYWDPLVSSPLEKLSADPASKGGPIVSADPITNAARGAVNYSPGLQLNILIVAATCVCHIMVSHLGAA